MSGQNSRGRGRPKRNIAALHQQQQKQKQQQKKQHGTLQISQQFYNLDVKQPLNILKLDPTTCSSTQLNNSRETQVQQQQEEQEQEERDRNNSAANDSNIIITPPLSETVINHHHTLLSSSSEGELSSEEELVEGVVGGGVLSRFNSPLSTVIQGVELSRLPKVHYTSLLDNDEQSTAAAVEEDLYELQQKAQEDQLLALQSCQLGNKNYKRPENHYIHYIEPSEIELYDTIEYDMDEQDKSWLELYNMERRKESLGDISPFLFECIMDKLEKEWFHLIKDAPKAEEEEVVLPEDSACAVCDDTEVENSNAIVFCDGCNVAVHQDCYGIPYIPEGQWLCRKCMISPEYPVSCIFCPNEGGAFKQTNTNQWGHLLCAIWIPEVGVSNPIYMEPIDLIENIPKSRWKLTCSICKKKQGACIQCDNKHCFSAFHVTCAKAAKLCMKMNSHTSQQEGVILKAYCDRHTPKEHLIDPPSPAAATTTTMKALHLNPSSSTSSCINGSSGRGRGRGRRRGRGGSTLSRHQHQQQKLITNNKVARAHQLSYSTGAPIAPDVILSKIDNLGCVKFSGIRKKPQLVTAIAHYWSLKRESRRGAPLLKRLHLEPWTATSNHGSGDSDLLIKQGVITQLRADLEKVRMLSEQSQKRERQKLERVRKQKAYLEMILFPLEYVIRPILSQFMEIDRKKYFVNHVTAEEAPDYSSIIAKSMCFTEIDQKLNAHEYTSLDQFKQDMALIWQNSMEYNQKETHYYKVASKMENASKKLFEVAEYRMSRLNLKDGVWDEPVDDAIFDYEAAEQDEDYKEEEKEKETAVVTKGPPVAAVLKTKEKAAARKRAKENRLRGIREARERKKAMQEQTQQPRKITRRSNQDFTVMEHQPLVKKKFKRKRTTVQEDQHVNDLQKEEIPQDTQITDSSSTSSTSTLASKGIPSDSLTEVQERHIQSLNVTNDDQKQVMDQCQELGMNQQVALSNSSVSAPTQQQQQSISYDIETMQLIVINTTPKSQEMTPTTAESNTTTTTAAVATPTTTGIKRKRSNPTTVTNKKTPTPRLTRSAGLKASIEELTKRSKISHEARALYASYNGVSHLERPVQEFKEDRKKSAPIGWVYLEEDDEEEKEREKEDHHEEQEKDSRSASASEERQQQQEQESTKPKKHAKPKRNTIPVPNFKRGEVVWARVTGFPSHPAKFQNWPDDECPSNILAGRRFQGDVLVEFLCVPENHKWGWVERNSICEIGDIEVDKARLAESLKRKVNRSTFINEAKEGYREAGTLIGLNPEPILDAVFNASVKTKRSKYKKKKIT